MEKIAVLNDIHGNLFLLNKALNYLKDKNISKFLICGDFLTDGPDDNKIIDILKSLDSEIILGNREESILKIFSSSNEITEKLNLSNIVNKDMSYLCNLREIDLVNKAYESLKNAQYNLDAGFSVDMIEIDLKSAWDYLGEIMGDSYEGELVDKIFSNFCLGK
jgi:tRNA U34 5-carboxymethylaminomethyl modifying GTPase MnmE/TrmE